MDSWNDVYSFGGNDDVTTRLRRLERGRQYQRRGSLIAPSSDLVSMPAGLLGGTQQLDLASAELLTRGSLPPAGVKGKFGFTATDSSITIYWDGTNGSELLSIIRASGAVVQVAGSSLTITGLTASAEYGFLPFRSVFNDCGLGWVVGDAGAPQFAFTAAARSALAVSQTMLVGREQLTRGFIAYSTAAAGGATGPDPGTGPGDTGPECVMLGTAIEPLGGGEYETRHIRHGAWMVVEAEKHLWTLICTAEHPLLTPDRGKQETQALKVGDWVITNEGEKKLTRVAPLLRQCTKVAVKMEHGHLFFANGFLSHNIKQFSDR